MTPGNWDGTRSGISVCWGICSTHRFPTDSALSCFVNSGNSKTCFSIIFGFSGMVVRRLIISLNVENHCRYFHCMVSNTVSSKRSISSLFLVKLSESSLSKLIILCVSGGFGALRKYRWPRPQLIPYDPKTPLCRNCTNFQPILWEIFCPYSSN